MHGETGLSVLIQTVPRGVEMENLEERLEYIDGRFRNLLKKQIQLLTSQSSRRNRDGSRLYAKEECLRIFWNS